jgi:hypothetical protein
MSWLAWRQMRVQAATGALALAALALLLGVLTARGANLDDGDVIRSLAPSQRSVFSAGTAILLIMPAIIGVFWGAPMITRELEAGTHRLAWSQTISRRRWLWTKVGLGALVTMATVGAASLLVGWWSAPIDHAISATGDRGGMYVARIEPLVFDGRGIVPVAHALFAFVLGVAVGLIARRTLPAMATTLAIVVALQVAMPLAIREHLVAPVRTVTTIAPMTPITLDRAGAVTLQVQAPGDWLLARRLVDGRGRPATAPASFVTCLQRGSERAVPGCITALSHQGYRAEITAQPASRFWTLQWAEAGLFLVLTAAACRLCAWRIGRV